MFDGRFEVIYFGMGELIPVITLFTFLLEIAVMS